MPFSGMMNDIVALVKQDGTVFPNIKSVVSGSSIVFDDVQIPLEEGDHLERKLPNGLKETYVVLDRGYYDKFHGIPAHYQAKVRKLTTIEVERIMRPGISIHGDNSRVNINSTDRSSNLVLNGSDVFEKLSQAIRERVAAESERDSLLVAIEGMRSSNQQDEFLAHYQRFIASAANHMTIIGPFLPALAKFFGGGA
ncbi:MAG: hypothetical protein IBJ03_01965 [Gemmatimonadaceae bacterium]|nr:hypothetical protein [Gemmatimonadaceae bacterium]